MQSSLIGLLCIYIFLRLWTLWPPLALAALAYVLIAGRLPPAEEL